jgi:anti-sigma B factor antagonist
MELAIQQCGGAKIVRPEAARIDAAVAIEFKDLMRPVCAEADGRILLDLSEVQFIDSSGLGAVVAVMKMLEPPAILELVTLNPTVDMVFRLTRMDSVFRIHATLDAALAQDAA